MKQFYTCCLTLVCTIINIALLAQNFNVIDVNKSSDASPQDYQTGSPYNQFAVLNNIVCFFGASDGTRTGIWRSDGTTGGTFMLKDLSAYPNDIIVSGEKIFFTTNYELWVSDGTKTGTRKIHKISFNKGNENPIYLTDVNGEVYFFTDYGNQSAAELWKTDGTDEGTTLVVNFYDRKFGFQYGGQTIINVNGRAFFVMPYQNNFELWTTDGTKEDTVRLTWLDANNYQANPFDLTAVNGKLYFGLFDGSTFNDRLYESDGTPAGTHAVSNAANFIIYRQTNSVGDYVPFTVKNNTIFFAATSADAGTELYKLNTNADDKIRVVKDILPGADNANPYNITNVNNTIYFNATYNDDAALWKTDGTEEGTVLVKDINPGGTNWYTNFTAVGDKLMFSYYNDKYGFELWQSNGTEAGTKLVKDIYPGLYSSTSNDLTYVNGYILLSANDGVHGQELWKSDGTTAGTFLLKDINSSTTESSNPLTADGTFYYGFQAIATSTNKLLFNAATIQGDELCVSDGTAGGTHIVKDIDSGSSGSYPHYFANLNNKTYFIAASSPDIKHESGNEVNRLWKSDGTNAGTSVISTPFDNEYGYMENLVATSNALYILVYNYSTSHQEIWRSDGTSAGTSLLQDINTYFEMTIIPAGADLYYTVYDGSTFKLWVTDGTVSGTKLVTKLTTTPFNFTAYNGKLYFSEDYYGGLWSSDGTKAGTKKIKNLTMDYFDPFQPVATKGKLFFYADGNDGYGEELWATDGTTAGTHIVKDINKGNYSSRPYYSLQKPAVAIDSMLYFVADDAIHGLAIWKSDGTAKGTQLLKSFYFSIPDQLANANGRLYFTNNDSLWTSDGTGEGTVKINDVNLAVTQISNLIAVGDTLFFSCFAGSIGDELGAGAYAANALKQSKQYVYNDLSVNNNTQLTLFPNPAKDNLNVKINSSNNSIKSLTVTDISGKTVLNKNTNSIKGETIIQLDVSKFIAGTYFIKLIAAGGSEKVVKKFVKE